MGPSLGGYHERRIGAQCPSLQERICDTTTAIAEAWSSPDLLRSQRPECVEIALDEGYRDGEELTAAGYR